MALLHAAAPPPPRYERISGPYLGYLALLPAQGYESPDAICRMFSLTQQQVGLPRALCLELKK